jgi:hypothetical protein
MTSYKKRIDEIVDKFVDRDLNELCECKNKCAFDETSHHKIVNAIKMRIHILMNNRISVPYTDNFTKCENKIIYKMVTNVLLHLSFVKSNRTSLI